MSERRLPTGTVTFLFSDLEGSTRLVRSLGATAFSGVLERHNAILREAFSRHGGIERGTQGDSFLVTFAEAPAALAAAVDAQRAIGATAWPGDADVRVRMGLHSGLGTLGGDDYVGVDVNLAARVAAAAHGDQILVSDATRALVEQHLPEGVELRPLGPHHLRDVPRPEPLHQVVGAGLRADFPPLRATGASHEGNLPARLTSFVGREHELRELGDHLGGARLLTLVGPGGTGKSSLAVELARRERERYDDGAWFMSLEAITDPEVVPSVLAAGFGLVAGSAGTVEERLRAFLADRSLLLVIDNFEHVLAAAPLLPDLLRSAPRLTIVVTSRSPLRVAGEQEYPVAPLSVPHPDDDTATSDALQLFEDRAARVRPGYRLVEEDLAAVGEICRRLDGLPLGIEIAASRMAVLQARDIAERLATRLDLPGSGSRDTPERQRTLEAAIAWSYDLLTDPERHLLARLSCFVGSFGVAEAELVCGPAGELGVDVLDGITTLAEHSLIQPVASPHGTRFRLLATVRMFAAERLARLGEADEIGRRHAAAYLGLAERLAARIPGRGQKPLLDVYSEEHNNLRAAVDHAVTTGDPRTALRYGAALWRFWQARGHLDEGRATIERIITMPGADGPLPERLGALDAAGGVAWWQGDLAASDRYYEEQVALAREIGDQHALGYALFNAAHTRVHRPDRGEAERTAEEAVRLLERTGDERTAARLGWAIANERVLSDPASARTILEALLARYEELEDDFYVAMAAGSLGWSLVASGALEAALTQSVRPFEIALDTGDVGAAVVSLRGVEVLFDLLGLDREAAILDGAFEAAASRYGITPPHGFTQHVNRFWAGAEALRAKLPDGEFAALHRSGTLMDLDEVRALVEATVRDVRRRAVDPATNSG